MYELLFPAPAAPGELRFVHGHAASLVIGALALGGALAAWLFMGEGPGRLLFAAGTGVAGLRFLVKALRRHELVIDPEARRWRRRSGLFFAPRSDSGSLDDLDAVALRVDHVGQGTGTSRRIVPLWNVSLEFVGDSWDGTPLVIHLVEEDEPAAYREFEDYARRLRVDAVDRTALEPIRRPWHALDAPVGAASETGPFGGDDGRATTAGQPDAPRPGSFAAEYGRILGPEVRDVGVGGAEDGGAAERGSAVEAEAHGREALDAARVRSDVPPPGSGIEVAIGAEGRRILLPPHGVSAGVVITAAFGAIVTVFGTVFAAYGLGILPPGAEPSGIAFTAFGGLFAATGASMVRAAIRRARAREWVLDTPGTLRFGSTRDRSTEEAVEIAKAAIEEVAARTPTESGARITVMGQRIRTTPEPLLRVRSDETVVRVGRGLGPEALEWLRATIAAAASERRQDVAAGGTGTAESETPH